MVSGCRGKAQINMMNQIDVCHVLIGWPPQEGISHWDFDQWILRIYVVTLIKFQGLMSDTAEDGCLSHADRKVVRSHRKAGWSREKHMKMVDDVNLLPGEQGFIFQNKSPNMLLLTPP